MTTPMTPSERWQVRTARKDNAPGTWNSSLVTIYDHGDDPAGTPVGSYERSYPSLFNTFHPFTWQDRNLAFISADYWRSALFDLDRGEIIATEAPPPSITLDDGRVVKAPGFCPTGFWTPPEPDEDEPARDLFAIVAGCYWGDDWSWKLQYLDLTSIDDGIIHRDDRFGYIRQPSNATLDQVIAYDPDTDRLEIGVAIDFDRGTGAAESYDTEALADAGTVRQTTNPDSPLATAMNTDHDTEAAR